MIRVVVVQHIFQESISSVLTPESSKGQYKKFKKVKKMGKDELVWLNHSKGTCWKLYGRPQNKKNGETKRFHAKIEEKTIAIKLGHVLS